MSRNYSIVKVTIFSLTTSKCIPAPHQLSPMAAASACQHASTTSCRNGVYHAGCNSMPPRQSLSGSALELLCAIWYRKIVPLRSALPSFNQLTSFVTLASCSTVSWPWSVMSIRQSELVSSTATATQTPRRQSTLKQLVCAFIFSRLDYCNAVIYGLLHSTVNPLQRVQNTPHRSHLGYLHAIMSVQHWKNCTGCQSLVGSSTK